MNVAGTGEISLDILAGIIDSTCLQVVGTGRIAQLGEHSPYKAGVTGSIPVPPTRYKQYRVHSSEYRVKALNQ